MDLSLDVDDLGRLVATLADDNGAAMLTALGVREPALDLEHALSAAAAAGYGECVWHEFDCDYRWILRVSGRRVSVTILACRGTLTGWEYVFGGECEQDRFDATMRSELARLLSS